VGIAFLRLNKFDGLWIFSAAMLTILAQVFYRNDTHFVGGAYYIFFVMTFVGAIFLINLKFRFEHCHFSPFGFSLGIILLLFSRPLFENDHYRYLFEGKVFLMGLNPYTHAPNHEIYEKVTYLAKDLIGYNYLTTIYPPGALLYFGLASIFGDKFALSFLMLANSLIVYWLYKKLFSKVNPLFLVMLIPFFQKEYIQGVHIDLLAALGMGIFLCEKKSLNSLWGVALAYWVKFLGLALLPIYFIKVFSEKESFKKITAGVLLFISLPLTLYVLVGDDTFLSGANSFGRNWVWNSGFYSILVNGLNVYAGFARQMTLLSYCLYLLIVGIIFLIQLSKQKYILHKRQSYIYCYLIFSGLMFFSPVYNAWYAIWFLLPGLLLNNFSAVMYALFSCWGYIFYGHKELILVGEFFTHIWFPLSLLELRNESELSLMLMGAKKPRRFF